MQEEKVRETEKNCKYGEENGHGKCPSLETIVQKKCLQEKMVQQSMECNVTEMTKTSGNVMGISQNNKSKT